MKARRIKTKSDYIDDPIRFGGWFQGKQTYLRIGNELDECIGTLTGQKLYRLAKAIVRQFEGDL